MKLNLNYESPSAELLLVAFEECILSGHGNAEAPNGISGGVYGDDIDY